MSEVEESPAFGLNILYQKERDMMRKAILVLSIVPVLLIFGGGLSPREASGSNGIVGAEVCKGCHEDHFKTYMMSTHAKKGIPNSPANNDACETCHGPGAAHVEKSGERGVGIFIFSKRIADAKSKSAKCLSCHGEGRDLSFWDMGKHNGVKPVFLMRKACILGNR